MSHKEALPGQQHYLGGARWLAVHPEAGILSQRVVRQLLGDFGFFCLVINVQLAAAQGSACHPLCI